MSSTPYDDVGYLSSAKEFEELRAAARNSIFNTTFRRGIVIEVINDPEFFDKLKYYSKASEEQDQNNIQNQFLAEQFEKINIPRNSVIFTEADITGDDLALAVPFFPDHIMFPLKPGESIWYTIIDGDFFWIARAPGDSLSEDVNFTHFDRKFLESKKEIGTIEKSEGTDEEYIPVFNDGTEISSGKSMKLLNYLDIITGTVFELPELQTDIKQSFDPVPVYRKRPGDFVIQGSNNTCITLGQERISAMDQSEAEISTANFDLRNPNSTIDIVVGRGRIDKTGVSIITNELGFFERDKNPEKSGLDSNIMEGDPHEEDACRILLAKDPITVFSLENEKINMFDLEDDQKITEIGSTIYGISDSIKLISRAAGNLQLIKKGILDENEEQKKGCSILLAGDGKIQLFGEKIFLGKPKSEDGAMANEEEDPEEFPGGSQPYILYKELKELLEKVLDDMDEFCSTLETHISPGNGAQSPQILQAASTLKTKISERKEEIPTIKSKRIFGE